MSNRTRKTVEVEQLRGWVNRYNASVSHVGTADGRRAVNALLDTVLMETGNYKGYSYVDGADAVRSGDYDDTRRRYH